MSDPDGEAANDKDSTLGSQPLCCVPSSVVRDPQSWYNGARRVVLGAQVVHRASGAPIPGDRYG